MKKERGFTLIEIVVALALFTITMTYGLSFFLFGTRSQVRAEIRRATLQECTGFVELYRGTLDTDIAVTFPSMTVVDVGIGGGTALASVTEYIDRYRHPLMATGVECFIMVTTATLKDSGVGLAHFASVVAPQFEPYQ